MDNKVTDKKFFTEEDVKNLECFLTKHKEKILDLLDKNSPNYIMRKSFVSERMRLKDTFEEYLNGGPISEKSPSKDRFEIIQQSKRDIVGSKEFRSLSREEQKTKLREIIPVIDDLKDEDLNKISEYYNPYWGKIDEDSLRLVTSFGELRFEFKDALIVSMNLRPLGVDLTEEEVDFIRNNRNKIYSVKFIIGDTIKTFVSKQTLISRSVWYGSDNKWGAKPYGIYIFDKEFYDITSSKVYGFDSCNLDGFYCFTEEQIKLYEYVRSSISKYIVSNKSHNSESYEENIKQTIKDINSDMSSWNSDNLALLKLSI